MNDPWNGITGIAILVMLFWSAYFVRWLKDRKPKQRRCRDCKWLVFPEDMFCEWDQRYRRINPENCNYYARKFWKIGRAK